MVEGRQFTVYFKNIFDFGTVKMFYLLKIHLEKWQIKFSILLNLISCIWLKQSDSLRLCSTLRLWLELSVTGPI